MMMGERGKGRKPGWKSGVVALAFLAHDSSHLPLLYMILGGKRIRTLPSPCRQ